MENGMVMRLVLIVVDHVRDVESVRCVLSETIVVEALVKLENVLVSSINMNDYVNCV